jgi:hypothetical protein
VPVAERARAQRGTARGRQFSAVMAAIAARLPLGLARIVPATLLLGFAVISMGTFGVDLALLTLLHGLPPAALTLAYLTACGAGWCSARAEAIRVRQPGDPRAVIRPDWQ